METIADFDFLALHFDEHGKPPDDEETEEFLAAAKNASDVLLIAHGFRNSEADAKSLYFDFLTNFRDHVDAGPLSTRRWLTGGVFWPSKSFRESSDLNGSNTESLDDGDAPSAAERAQAEEKLRDLRDTLATEAQKPNLDAAIRMLDQLPNDRRAQDDFVDLVRSLLNDVSLDSTEGIDEFRAREGSRLLDVLQAPVLLPGSMSDRDSGSVQTVNDGAGSVQALGNVVNSVFGAVGRFLNMTTWYVMKERAGTVGANGVADLVRAIRDLGDAPKVHLVGHSLGGRLMASCAKSLGKPAALDSLSLLEAAFSHYGFSETLDGKPGFFRDVFSTGVVKGPAIETYSMQDEVVGHVYALASRLAHDNTEALGDENDEFGGIGRNGSQNFPAARRIDLSVASAAYVPSFPAGVLTNLNGSGGLIQDHGDVTNPAVTWAVACAIECT
jgi:hypothetical protein